MAGLSSIFGGTSGDDSTSSQDNSQDSNIVGDATSTLGLDASSSQSSFNQDEDGNTSSQTNDNAVGLDTGTDGLLGAVNDVAGSSDEAQS